MDNFAEAFQVIVGSCDSVEDAVDINVIYPFLQSVYTKVLCNPVDRVKLKDSLLLLVDFLISPKGRVSSYYQVVDSFFQDSSDLWRSKVSDVSKDFQDIFDEFCFLHGAIQQPKFHVSAEQIKAMIEKVFT